MADEFVALPQVADRVRALFSGNASVSDVAYDGGIKDRNASTVVYSFGGARNGVIVLCERVGAGLRVCISSYYYNGRVVS
jgi:hypothetical protein